MRQRPGCGDDLSTYEASLSREVMYELKPKSWETNPTKQAGRTEFQAEGIASAKALVGGGRQLAALAV